MAVTNYHTVDGEIVGERTGAGRINYATDALGSVSGTLVNGQLQMQPSLLKVTITTELPGDRAGPKWPAVRVSTNGSGSFMSARALSVLT